MIDGANNKQLGFMGQIVEREGKLWTWVDGHRWWVLLLIIGLNIGLKAPYLGGTSLFLDEAVAIHDTQGSIAETIAFSASDPTPPLYYLVLGLWCKLFGISEASARFPSMLFSTLTAGLIFLIGRRFFAARAGVYASLLFTCSNVAINFSHEARAYALAGLLMSCSYYAFLSLSEARERQWWPALGLLLANALLLYTHYVTAMGIAAQALLSLWLLRKQARNFLYYVASQLLVLGLWLPWLLMNRARIPDSKVTSWLGPPDLTTLKYVYFNFAGQGWLPLLAAGIVVVGGAVVGWQFLRRRAVKANGFSLVTFGGWFLLATGLQVLVSYWYMPVFELRYALYALPGACLLVGAIVASLPQQALLGNGLMALYLALAVGSIDLNPQKTQDWRAAVAAIQAIETEQTGMVVNAYYQYMPLSYYLRPAYFKDYDHTMPLLGADQIHLGKDTLIVPKIDDSLITNVILVLSHNELVDPENVLIDYMKRHYCLSYRASFTGIKLMQFTNPPCKPTEGGHFEWDYETPRTGNAPDKFADDPTDSLNHVTFVTPTAPYSASFSVIAQEVLEGGFKSLEVRFRALGVDVAQEVMMVSVMEHEGESYNWSGYALAPMLTAGKWQECSILVKVPEIKAPTDKLSIYFWSNGGGECYFDDLEVDFWE